MRTIVNDFVEQMAAKRDASKESILAKAKADAKLGRKALPYYAEALGLANRAAKLVEEIGEDTLRAGQGFPHYNSYSLPVLIGSGEADTQASEVHLFAVVGVSRAIEARGSKRLLRKSIPDRISDTLAGASVRLFTAESPDLTVYPAYELYEGIGGLDRIVKSFSQGDIAGLGRMACTPDLLKNQKQDLARFGDWIGAVEDRPVQPDVQGGLQLPTYINFK